MSRHRAIATLVGVVLVGCSAQSEVQGPTTVAPATTAAGAMATSPRDDDTSTTPPPETSPTTLSPDAPAAIAGTSPDPCQWPALEPSGAGELTYVSGGFLWSSELEGLTPARCLADLGSVEPASLTWSGTGSQVLLDNTSALGEAGPRPTGFGDDVDDVRWSMPTGVRTIAVVDGRLRKIEVGSGEVTDVSFLANHELVAYHPAGHHIVSSGTDDAGQFGIFLADNEGRNARIIVRGDSEPVITDLVFDSTGDELYFVADHGGHQHLHRLLMAGLVLSDVVDSAVPLAQLVVGPAGFRVAVRAGDCASPTAIASSLASRMLRAPDGFATPWLEPIGWSAGSLVVAARASGCDGPADLYLVGTDALSAGEWNARLLMEGVEHFALRNPPISPTKLNTDALPIESEAPG